MVDQPYKIIRLLSFQNAHNFGAVLQAYGLQQVIISMGYKDVKFLNYNPKYLSKRYDPFAKEKLMPGKTFKAFIGWLMNYPFLIVSSIIRNRCFNRSISNLLFQTKEKITNEEGLRNEVVDVLVCGSDQIWNTSITGSLDLIFLGKGDYSHLGYAISYAPSTELSSLTENKVINLCKNLDRFKMVSVREIQVRDELKKFYPKPIEVCVDPTLLCGRIAFDSIAYERIVDNNYILIYSYNPSEKLIQDMIKKIPNYSKYTIHTILLGEKGVSNFFDSNVHSAITVEKFLSYVKYASYVVTNSFHGLSFSLLFEKNFNVAYYEGMHVRCLSLLQQINMERKLIRNAEECSWNEIDYSIINDKLDAIRGESYCFLKNALEWRD